MIQAYAESIARAEQLVIIGFSMAECDRDEFRRAISLSTNLQRITIANPTLSKELIGERRGLAPKFFYWPDGPDGQEVQL